MKGVSFSGQEQFGAVNVGMLDNEKVAFKKMKQVDQHYWEIKVLHEMTRGKDIVENIPKLVACELDDENIYLYSQALHKDMTKIGALPLKQGMTLKKRLRHYYELFKTLAGIHRHNYVH